MIQHPKPQSQPLCGFVMRRPIESSHDHLRRSPSGHTRAGSAAHDVTLELSAPVQDARNAASYATPRNASTRTLLPLDRARGYDRRAVVQRVLDVVALKEAKAGAAVALAGDDVQVAIPVKVFHVGS